MCCVLYWEGSTPDRCGEWSRPPLQQQQRQRLHSVPVVILVHVSLDVIVTPQLLKPFQLPRLPHNAGLGGRGGRNRA